MVSARTRGFTLVELLVSLIILGMLSAVLLGRLAYYQEMAGRIAMETTVRLIKTGLQIRLAEAIIANRQSEAAVLEIEDPFQWLDRRPANYGGVFNEYASPDTWYFDDQFSPTGVRRQCGIPDWNSTPAPARRSFDFVRNCSETGFRQAGKRAE